MDADTLKNLQKTEVKILKECIEVCEKLDIQYFAVYGTAIGAIRHKGFIPWDDDIDIAMTRENFNRFLQKAPALLPDNLTVQCKDSDPDWLPIHIKVKDNNTTFLEKGWETNRGHQGIFIDIFPFDYFPTTGWKNKIFRLKKKIYQNLTSISPTVNYWRQSGFKYKIYALLQPLLNVFYPKRQIFARKLESLINNLPPLPYLGNHNSKSLCYPAEWFRKVKKVTFEDIEICVPEYCHEYLTACYGDYMKMPPETERIPRHTGGIIDTERSYTYYMEQYKKTGTVSK